MTPNSPSIDTKKKEDKGQCSWEFETYHGRYHAIMVCKRHGEIKRVKIMSEDYND